MIEINQNYFYGWYAYNQDGEERLVFMKDGVLNVNSEKGDRNIFMRYSPIKYLFNKL